jgi:hypothetical protein
MNDEQARGDVEVVNGMVAPNHDIIRTFVQICQGLCVFNEKWATSYKDWSPIPLDLRSGVADFAVDYITFIA